MEWSDEFATGVKFIDDQHKMLFRMVADYRLSLDEGGGERVYDLLLGSLDAYARAHFGAEEACMVKYACPAAEANAAAHARFVAMLDRFRQRFLDVGFERGEAQRLVDTLERWLVDHICKLDVRLRPYAEADPFARE